jgi:hypothetical protein
VVVAGCHSWARVGARSGGAACGRARLHAVDEKEMMQTLDNVRVKLCWDACFLDDIVYMVCATGEKGGGVGNYGSVRCACAAHDYGKNVDCGTRPLLANCIGEGDICVANHLCVVGEVVVCAVFPFPYLNIFNRGVPSAFVRVSDESRFEKPDEVGFVCRGSEH